MKRETVFITGAGTRIGAAIAQALADQNFEMVLHYHHSKPSLKISSRIRHIKADLSKTKAEKKITRFLEKNKIKAQIVIFNASNFLDGKVANTSEQLWEQTFNVNLRSVFFLSRFFIQNKTRHFIFIGDQRAENPYAGKAAYLISKAGIHALIKILAKELPQNIKIHGIAPGIVLFPKNYSQKLRKQILKTAGLKKEAGPEAVVKAVLKLVNNKKIKKGTILKVG